MDVEHSTDNLEGKFKAIDEGKEIGKMTYVKKNSDTITILHTEVDDKYQGQGVASDLLNEMTKFIRNEDFQVKTKCSYVEHQYSNKEAYSDISLIT